MILHNGPVPNNSISTWTWTTCWITYPFSFPLLYEFNFFPNHDSIVVGIGHQPFGEALCCVLTFYHSTKSKVKVISPAHSVLCQRYSPLHRTWSPGYQPNHPSLVFVVILNFSVICKVSPTKVLWNRNT